MEAKTEGMGKLTSVCEPPLPATQTHQSPAACLLPRPSPSCCRVHPTHTENFYKFRDIENKMQTKEETAVRRGLKPVVHMKFKVRSLCPEASSRSVPKRPALPGPQGESETDAGHRSEGSPACLSGFSGLGLCFLFFQLLKTG